MDRHVPCPRAHPLPLSRESAREYRSNRQSTHPKREGPRKRPLTLRHLYRTLKDSVRIARRWAIQRRPHLANQFSFSLLQECGFHIFQNAQLNSLAFRECIMQSMMHSPETIWIARPICFLVSHSFHNTPVVPGRTTNVAVLSNVRVVTDYPLIDSGSAYVHALGDEERIPVIG